VRVLLFRCAVLNGIIRHLESAIIICCASADELLLLARCCCCREGYVVCLCVCAAVHTRIWGHVSRDGILKLNSCMKMHAC
jgi:hypothetical protein